MSIFLSRIQASSRVGTSVDGGSLRRLQYAAVCVGVASLIGLALIPFTEANTVGLREGHVRPFWVLPVVSALAAAMYLCARWNRLTIRFRIRAGLVWMLALCIVASIFRHDLPYEDHDVVRGISLVPYGLLLYAALVPTRPLLLTVMGFFCTISDILVFLAVGALGTDLPKPEVWLWLFAPNVVGLTLAIITSNVIYSLGQSLESARELGSYRLVQPLGTGGMGEVWLAEHHTLARPAAIKLIRSDLDPDVDLILRERFLEEAQAIARLENPHTVALYDFGVNAEGTLFYVMEYLTGRDLETLIKEEGILPPARTAHLLEQACRSLEEAHAADLVHRDLKPANLFTCRLGLELDVLKVLDFGLVQVIGESTSRVGGTPGYIAPETLTGRVTAAADIYALGCIAYTCLVGEPPFKGETVEETLDAHLHSDPVDVAAAAPQHVPPELARAIMQCISRDPNDRPASCSELISMLRACGLEWSPDDAAQWWAAHPELPSPTHTSQTSQSESSATVFSLF